MILQWVSLYLFAAVIVTSILLAIAYSKGQSQYLKILVTLCLTIDIYLLGYLLELNSGTLRQMQFWNLIQYFGLSFYPALWLALGMYYTGRQRYIQSIYGVLLFAIPVITFIMRLTNDIHHLFYQSMTLKTDGVFNIMLLGKGPWYYVQSGYIIIAMLVNTYMLWRTTYYKKQEEQRNIKWMLLGTLMPYLGMICILLDVGHLGIDYGALTLPIAVVLIILALVKYDFLEIKTFARETIFENSLEGIILINNKGKITDYNQAGKLFFQWLGIPLSDQRIDQNTLDNPALLSAFTIDTTQKLKVRAEGKEHYLEIRAKHLGTDSGYQQGKMIRIQDVTSVEEMQMQLKALASTDELSGLANRRAFMQRASSEFERAKRYKDSFAAVMIDFDYFKKINDTYGHSGGDQVIRQFSQTMENTFRNTDILGRMGGEEFAVILVNTTEAEAIQKMNQFREQIAADTIVFNQKEIRLQISIGIAMMYEEANTIEEILKYADIGLYQSKNSGRNKTTCYKSE